MQFNKLYNLILESIITQNKQSRKAMIEKSNIKDKMLIIRYLDSIATASNKTADLLCKFFCNGEMISIYDDRIQEVIDILNRYNNIDIQQVKSVNQLLEKYQVKVKELNLDSIKQFSQKKEYDKGVVVYKVDNSKQGQEAVRKVVDAYWGEDSNPWCLISRSDSGLDKHYEMFWQKYNAYPKHIAFQNGKLLAFCANTKKHNLWWDRKDQPSQKLKLINGDYLQTEHYSWDEEQLQSQFIRQHKLVWDQKIKMYNSDQDLEIENEDLINGHFPVKLGVVRGNFWCSGCSNLLTLQGGPRVVFGDYNCSYCHKLKNLKGMAKLVKKAIKCNSCYNLQSLEGCPEEYKDQISYKGSPKLNFLEHHKALKFNEETQRWDYPGNLKIFNDDIVNGHFPFKFGVVGGSFDCNYCEYLSTLQGAPTRVEGNCLVDRNRELTSLKGAPQYVGGNFFCDGTNITSLQGGPKVVKGDYNCQSCNLTSLIGAPKEVGGNFKCSWNIDLKSLQDGPEKVGKDYNCESCHDLACIKGPKYIGENFECCGQPSLSNIDNDIVEIGGDLFFINVRQVKNIDQLKAKTKGKTFFYLTR